jgi:hypothetical protein
MHQRPDREASSVSLGFVFTFAALLRFGPLGALLVGALGTLCSGLFPGRQRLPPHQIAFNTALIAFSSVFAGRVFLLANRGTLDLEPLRSFPAVLAACLCFFLIEAGAVAMVIALCTGQKAGSSGRTLFCGRRPPMSPAPASARWAF